MVKTKTANGQDRLGQDQDLKKMVLRPRPVLKPLSPHYGKWAFGGCGEFGVKGHLGIMSTWSKWVLGHMGTGQMAKEHSGQMGTKVYGDLGQIGSWGK